MTEGMSNWQGWLYVAAVLIPLGAFIVELLAGRWLGRLNAYVATDAIAAYVGAGGGPGSLTPAQRPVLGVLDSLGRVIALVNTHAVANVPVGRFAAEIAKVLRAILA